MAELDALDPVPETVRLSTGTVVEIQDLKARQFFKLLRIITHGLRDTSMLNLDHQADPRVFGTQLLGMVVLAIPDAEDQAIEFIQSMVKPVGLIEGRRQLNKADTERNAELWERVLIDLDNPELEDLVDIIEAIVKREAEDIQALGKRLSGMFKMAERTGQLPNPPTNTSSADSPASSTSSRRNTGGRTKNSSASRSDESDSASPPSGVDARDFADSASTN